MTIEKQFASHSKILVVEDEPLLRLDIADQLRSAGFSVVETDNAEKAAALIEADTELNIIVTDLRMPGQIDGAQLIRWIRTKISATKIVIVLSSYVDANWDLPVDAIFPKPVRVEDLLVKLRELSPPMR